MLKSLNIVMAKTLSVTFTAVLTAGFLVTTILGQESLNKEIRPLVLGQPVEREMKGGEAHSYSIILSTSQYIHLVAEQKGIDVEVRLVSPEGEEVAKVDSCNGAQGPEPVFFVSYSAGNYRLDVRSLLKEAALGRYEVKINELRTGTEDDKKVVSGEKALREADLFQCPGTESGLRSSIKKFDEALSLFRAAKDLRREAETLNQLGVIFRSLDEYRTAIDKFSAALELDKSIGDKVIEADAVGDIGATYHRWGNIPLAIDYYTRALPLSRALGDLGSETNILFSRGNAFANSGQNQKAIQDYEKALSIFRAAKSVAGEARTLNSLGMVYFYLGEYQKAAEYLTQSLPLIKSVNNRIDTAATLSNLATVYSALNDQRNALESLSAALELVKGRGYSVESSIRTGIGWYYAAMGDNHKALENYNAALTIVKDNRIRAQIYINAGSSYASLGDNETAIQFFTKGVVLSRAIQYRRGEASALARLQDVWSSIGSHQLAIIYGKQAVNKYQELRSNVQGLNTKTQVNYLKTFEASYRRLAGLLISEGRLAEAQQVLALLKEGEFEQLARGGETADTIPYSRAEADVIAKIEHLVALEQERAELQRLEARSTDQETKLKQLRLDINAANKAFDDALDAIRQGESSVSARAGEIRDGQELQGVLGKLGKETASGVVALYTLLGDEGDENETEKAKAVKSRIGWVVMVTDYTYKAYPIDMTNLENTVFQFRDALASDKYNPQPLAEKIYTAIFRQTSEKQKTTLEADLLNYAQSHKNITLMWSLDGVLRYIPMAALHDGKGYLIEKYRNAVFTKKAFIPLTDANQAHWRALGLGVSEKREGFDALPGVKVELETIVREPNRQTGIMNGSIKLNDNFKKQMFFNTIGNGSFPVVHIASHYSFNPAQQDASFLLVGDGRLTFGELKENKNLFGTVDLLTLSACDTAITGNGKEAEGFAYLAQELGAKSVIASLWKVSDRGTPELMFRFYKLRAENPRLTKGEAFRQAQLSLLQPITTSVKNGPPVSRSEVINVGNTSALPLFVKDEKRPFAHPHYWSSFVLIGNWR